MDYTLPLSLEHTALVNTAVELWRHPDIKDLISSFHLSVYSSRTEEKWKAIEKKVIEKVQELSLPKYLKNKVTCIIKPIGLQIFKWIEYHENFCDSSFIRKFTSNLCWTSQGMLDQKKTAKPLIDDNSLDIVERYKLACIYCFEEHIRNLWNDIPEESKEFLYDSDDPSNIAEYPNNQNKIVVFWTYYIKGEANKLETLAKRNNINNTISEYVFQKAVENGNETAVRYFWEKLSDEEKERNIIKSAVITAQERCSSIIRPRSYYPQEFYTSILRFLLSKMSEEQQVETFKEDIKRYENRHSYILRCFLDWPWQGFFMPTARCMWDFLPKEEYVSLLSIIIKRIKNNHREGFDYQELLGELWCESPDSFKRYVFDDISSWAGWHLLSDLFKIEDIDSVKLILKYATAEEKKQIIFSEEGIDICVALIYKGKWNLIEMFIEECLACEKEVLELKSKLIYRHNKSICTHLVCKDKFEPLERFVKWCFSSEEEIINFKRKLAYEEVDGICVNLVPEEQWELIEKFLDWCSLSQNEISEIKKELILEDVVKRICFNLIDENKWELAETFLKWCISSSKDIIQFKKELVYSDRGEETFSEFVSGSNIYDEDGNPIYENKWELVEKFLTWFLSSKKVVTEFIEYFSEKDDFEDKNTILKLLDNHAKNMATSEVNVDKESDYSPATKLRKLEAFQEENSFLSK